MCVNDKLMCELDNGLDDELDGKWIWRVARFRISHSYTVSELSQLIIPNSYTLRFRATLWGLRENVRCSPCAHWKARSGLPISM